MTVEYMTHKESRAYRRFLAAGKACLAVAVVLFIALAALYGGAGGDMTGPAWLVLWVDVAMLALTLLYFAAAGRVTRGGDA